MFDTHARDLIEKLPALPGLNHVECRRILSRAYLLVVDARIHLADEEAPSAEAETLRLKLQQMANALESVAVFDPLNGVDVAGATREASAFVAAEALSLVAELSVGAVHESISGDPLQDARTYALFESAFLFIIAGYDINAVAVMSRLPGLAEAAGGQTSMEVRHRSGARLCRRLEALCRGQVNPSDDGPPPALGDRPALLDELSDDTRTRLYEILTKGIEGYLEWLGGGREADVDGALWQISQVRRACQGLGRADAGTLCLFPFADVYHLASLVTAAVGAAKERSVVHRVPPPAAGDQKICNQFPAYIRARARGSARSQGRPLLWPSTLEYVRSCLPGPSRDAVVSMPTGSGKSFLAELAVVHALARGWVLYLAPTNALVHQIRRDLDRALETFSHVKVSPFVGGAEYTTLSDEEVASGGFVGVMTPEKCALALRLYPAAFVDCALCVFDECHLLNDPNRGAVADVLLAQLFRAAPDMRTLLMSAMVSNSDELADWLTSVRGNEALPSKIKWRPSRTARCFTFVDATYLASAKAELDVELAGKAGARTVSRHVPLGWLAGLSGPWTRDGADDYRTARLPLTVVFERKRNRKGQVQDGIESWKNGTGRSIAELLAVRGMPSINFVLSSRHHAFGSASRVKGTMPQAIGSGPFPRLVEAQLAVADAELGVETALRALLRKGVSVHTSAMLQVEQAASEGMFADGKARLMFATGTLAQGLNLPAVAVVVSGSKVGNPQIPPGVDAAAGLTRANELILNGFGRAGRPGFANQGIVILVSDEPLFAPVSDKLGGNTVIAKYPVLAEPDASIAIHSPIEKFLDDLLAPDDVEGATRLELALTSLLSTFEGEENAGTILRRTFAGFRRRAVFTPERAVLANGRIADLKARFLGDEGVPAWMPDAAMKAGVDFFRAQRMWQAYAARGILTPEQLPILTVHEWFDLFIDVLSHMPISRVTDYLDIKPSARSARTGRTPRPVSTTPRSRLGTLSAQVRDGDAIPWARPAGWDAAWRELGAAVLAYMEGRPFTEVGAAIFGTSSKLFTSGRTDASRGIPPVFKFIGDIIDRAMSIDAGCFLALHECWLASEHAGVAVPEPLQALPLCIRNGCDSLDVLAWFRFGFRQRTCAHALAAAFPLPDDVVSDAGRAQAVREMRREWLRAEPTDDALLLDFARVIVKDGSSERN